MTSLIKKSFLLQDGLFENNKWLPIKVNFLHWRLLLNRIPNRSLLNKRGVNVNSIFCPLCGLHEEDTQHLFAYCSFARSIWCHIRLWLHLLIIPSSSINILLNTANYGLRMGSKKQKAGDVVLKYTLWCIWKARMTTSSITRLCAL